MTKTGLILLAHGSRDLEWVASGERLCAGLTTKLDSYKVGLAFLELAEPNLQTVAENFYTAGIRVVFILPLFLAGGKHIHEDVPKLITSLQRAHPTSHVTLLNPVGESPEFLEMLEKMARGILGQAD